MINVKTRNHYFYERATDYINVGAVFIVTVITIHLS